MLQEMTESVFFTEKDDKRDAGSRGQDKKWDTFEDRGHFCLGASNGCTRERRVVPCL